ncbi:MAG: serine/threonine-protein phosphatase [Balneolia bacterium]|nr:serine/threonine-protein phosphatase [Balneolia bacterium]
MDLFGSPLLNNKYIALNRDHELKAFYDVPSHVQRKVVYAHLIIHSVVITALISFFHFMADPQLFWLATALCCILYVYIVFETASYMNEKARSFLKKYMWAIFLVLFIGSGFLGMQIGTIIFDPDSSFIAVFLPFLLGTFGCIFLFGWAQFGIGKLLEASGVLHSNMARVEADVRFASEVQKRLLKKTKIRDEKTGLNATAASVPASELGGDYFELSRQAGSLYASVGDISGHSFGAGLLMSMMKSALQTHLSYSDNPAEILGSLNKMMLNQSDRSMFATMVLLKLEPESGMATLSNAGHVPVFHFTKSTGRLEQRWKRGVGLGMSLRASYDNLNFETQKGDLIIIYSDGLAETRDESGAIRDMSYFRAQVEKQLINISTDADASYVSELILSSVQQEDSAIRQEDDQTLIVIKV